MRVAKIAVVHEGNPTALQSVRSVRTNPKVRTVDASAREAHGALLAEAIEAAGVSRCSVARALDVDEALVRRWEAGGAPIALEALDRLPVTVALRLVQLVETRVRARMLPRCNADYLRALTANFAAVLEAKSKDETPRAALLALADTATEAATRGLK